MPEYNPTIFDCKDISGYPFQLTAKEPRSVGRFKYAYKGDDGAKFRLADLADKDSVPGNVLIKDDGTTEYVPLGDDYFAADEAGNGRFRAPRKDDDGNIQKWEDTGRPKTESKLEFYVVREVDFGREVSLVKTGNGKRAGQALGTARVWDVWFKASVDAKLRAAVEAAIKAARGTGSLLEAKLLLTYDETKPPQDKYAVTFEEWAEPLPVSVTKAKGGDPAWMDDAPDMQVDELPF